MINDYEKQNNGKKVNIREDKSQKRTTRILNKKTNRKNQTKKKMKGKRRIQKRSNNLGY